MNKLNGAVLNYYNQTFGL